jgi:hypothetical protein
MSRSRYPFHWEEPEPVLFVKINFDYFYKAFQQRAPNHFSKEELQQLYTYECDRMWCNWRDENGDVDYITWDPDDVAEYVNDWKSYSLEELNEELDENYSTPENAAEAINGLVCRALRGPEIHKFGGNLQKVITILVQVDVLTNLKKKLD